MKPDRKKPGPKLPPRQRLLREAQKGLAASRTKLASTEAKAKPVQDRVRKARADHDEWIRLIAYLEGKTAEPVRVDTLSLSAGMPPPPPAPVPGRPVGRQDSFNVCPGLPDMARCGNGKSVNAQYCTRCRELEIKAGKRS